MEFKGKVPSVGLDQLDREHEALFNSSEALKEAAAGDMPAIELLQMFEEFLRGSVAHFKNEEAIMKPYRLHNTHLHIEEHVRLVKELKKIAESAAAGSPEGEWRPRLARLSDQLFDHIIVFDFEIRRHLADPDNR